MTCTCSYLDHAPAECPYPNGCSGCVCEDRHNDPSIYCASCDEYTVHPKDHPSHAVDPGPPTCPVHGPVGSLVDGKCRQCLGLRERSIDMAYSDLSAQVAYALTEATMMASPGSALSWVIGFLGSGLPADQYEAIRAAHGAALDRWYGAPVGD